MKLLLNKRCKLLPTEFGGIVEDGLEDKPYWISTKGLEVLEQKINLYDEDFMVETIQWLEDFTDFDRNRLRVIVEDKIILEYA